MTARRGPLKVAALPVPAAIFPLSFFWKVLNRNKNELAHWDEIRSGENVPPKLPGVMRPLNLP